MAMKCAGMVWPVFLVVFGLTVAAGVISRGEDGGVAERQRRAERPAEPGDTGVGKESYEAHEEDYEYEYDYGYPEDLAAWETGSAEPAAGGQDPPGLAEHMIDYYDDPVSGTLWEEADEQSSGDDSLYGDAYEADGDDWDPCLEDAYDYERANALEYIGGQHDDGAAIETSGRESLADSYFDRAAPSANVAADEADVRRPADSYAWLPDELPDELPDAPEWEAWYPPDPFPEERSGAGRTWVNDYLATLGEHVIEMGRWFEDRFGWSFLDFAEEVPGVAVFLAVHRLVERGGLDGPDGTLLWEGNIEDILDASLEEATDAANDGPS